MSSSNFPNDFFNFRSNINNFNNNNTGNGFNNFQQQNSNQFRSPLSGLVPDPQIRRPDLIGKRTYDELMNIGRESIGFVNRSVKPRFNNNFLHQQQYSSPISTLSPVDFSPIPSLSSGSGYLQPNRPQSWSGLNQTMPKVANDFSVPNLAQRNTQFWNNNNSVTRIPVSSGQVLSGQVLPGQGQEEEKKLTDQRLMELEKQLLGDDEAFIPDENLCALTESDWSDMQELFFDPISPTDSSTSTSASTPGCPKQALIDAAIHIADSKPQLAMEILTRLQNVANLNGSAEQRLVAYMVSALKSRVSVNERDHLEGYHGMEQRAAKEKLFDVSSCFKLGFMALNLAILEVVKEEGWRKIHVVDFEIGKGGQYVHLLHALAAEMKGTSLRITALGANDAKKKVVGEGLTLCAQKLGVCFSFAVIDFEITQMTREKLMVQPDEALVVNLAFMLYKVPDESVTVANPRDDLLRRVRLLSPVLMTLVEQELSVNTAPIITRVRDACEHYGALFESLESTLCKDHAERVMVEQGLGRKLINSVACEGRDRVERCEVFGKWRMRLGLVGFKQRLMSQIATESINSKLNSGTRGNPGFTVKLESGAICLGWKGRTLTVASAWR